MWWSCLRFFNFFKLKIWLKTKVMIIVKVQPLGLIIFRSGILLFLSYWGGLLGSTHCYFHEFMMKYYHELLKWLIWWSPRLKSLCRFPSLLSHFTTLTEPTFELVMCPYFGNPTLVTVWKTCLPSSMVTNNVIKLESLLRVM